MSDVDLPLWVQLLLIAGALAGSLLTVAGFMLKTGKGIRWVKDAVRDGVADVAREQADQVAQVAHERDRKLRAEVEADNAQLAKLIGEVAAEVKPNGGDSMHDKIDILGERLSGHIDESAQDRQALWDAVNRLESDR